MKIRQLINNELARRNGILNLKPSFVSRTTFFPGRRLRIHPNDLYAHGANRGALCERWICSVAAADNGDLTVENEGLSFINLPDNAELLLKDAISEAGDMLIGIDAMEKHGGMTAFAKFFDFKTPIGHHVHLMEKDSKLVGVEPKPEAYYFPFQYNAVDYDHAYTYFGLLPYVTKNDLINVIKNWGKFGDNGILELSVAYKLKLGTGWNVPAGILHAPGSLLTYEPQRVSDTSMFIQSMVQDKYLEKELLTKFIPEGKLQDVDFMADVLDWEANTDPNFKKNHYCEPIPVREDEKMAKEGYCEKWIAYGSNEFSAKEITIFPGKSVEIQDSASYGLIVVQGHGKMNANKIESPVCIRYGNPTSDEFFVSKKAAENGVLIKNDSDTDDLVLLKNFGSDCSESKEFVKTN
jgi:hypothetical protein